MKRLSLTLLFSVCFICKLAAHPHVFIDTRIEIVELDRANISWTFDPIESSNKIYFFDDNGDGELNSQEVINLYNEGFKSLNEFDFFLIIESDGVQFPIKSVDNFTVIIEDDRRVTFNFDIALPGLGSDNRLSISHFDTSYFISFADPVMENIILGDGLYSAIVQNRDKPFYYDPDAGRGVVIDTSKPKPGWTKTYLVELFISSEPMADISNTTKTDIRTWLANSQKRVYIRLSEYLTNARENPLSVWFILLLALLYGVVHALGPGHRKIVISSFILSEKSITYGKAISISVGSALIHSGSGVLSILLLNAIFKSIKPIFIDNITAHLEIVSYCGILLLSVVLIILKLIRRSSKSKQEKPIGLSLIIISSLVPCPGAIAIMLFALSLNMIFIGSITVLFMSIGMAITLSVISVITLKGKRLVNGKEALKTFSRVLEWAGLILLFLFSVFMITSL